MGISFVILFSLSFLKPILSPDKLRLSSIFSTMPGGQREAIKRLNKSTHINGFHSALGEPLGPGRSIATLASYISRSKKRQKQRLNGAEYIPAHATSWSLKKQFPDLEGRGGISS